MKVIGKAIGFDPVADAKRAEAIGYDGVRTVDHYFSAIPPNDPVALPHCFVTLSAAAVATERVLLTQTMVAASLHHPFEVAQAVATLDRISGGRAELGLGAGWLEVEHDSMGLALGSPGERLERVAEAASICRAMFANQGCVDFDGRIYQAHCEAAWPATPHTPEIMIGAHNPRLLKRAARVADRIDLLEGLSGGRPNFSDLHANTSDTLRSRISHATSIAQDAGRHVQFSATVNLQVPPNQARQHQLRSELAAAAGCSVQSLDRELLRVIAEGDRAWLTFQELASLGIDRVHVRPMDAATQSWLDEALPAIQGIV